MPVGRPALRSIAMHAIRDEGRRAIVRMGLAAAMVLGYGSEFLRSGLAAFTQGIEQGSQSVVIELKHQRQQVAELTRWESFAGEPGEIRAWQVGDQSALVFAEWHGKGYQALQVFGFHVA